jgi:transcriptional regulator with XRE-family HTH domain
MELLGGLAIVALVWYGSHQITVERSLTQGEFTSFLAAAFMMYAPVKKLSRVNASLQQAMAASERIFEVLDTHSEVKERPGALPLPRLRQGIEFRNVSFTYDEGTVVEGNCRTVVYRKLHEKFPHERRWRHIPARVLPKDIDERDVAILLGEMHVAGKNTWTPFEKAGHVYRLHEEFSLTQEEIAQRLRMSKSKVNQLIRAFDVMKNKYLRRFSGPGSARKFSYFEELYKKPQLREWVTTTSGAEDLFVEWVGTEKLDQGVHVRELPAILEDEEAIRALSEEGFSAAQKVIEEDNPAFTSKLFRRMVDMTEALKKAQLDDIQKVRKGGHSKARRIVQDLDKSLGHFVELCGLER